jgi:hypothetical protein
MLLTNPAALKYDAMVGIGSAQKDATNLPKFTRRLRLRGEKKRSPFHLCTEM